jgi:hypothetical protein
VSIESECLGKRRYETKAVAKRAEKHLRTAAGGSRQHVYKCSFCTGYHTGHGTARIGEAQLTRDEAMRNRAWKLDQMIAIEREALETAQTPTQRRYYEDRIAEFEIERAEALEAINVQTLEEAV